MHSLNDYEVWRQRADDMVREVELSRLVRQGDGRRAYRRRNPAYRLWWELRRLGGLLLKRLGQ